MGHGSVDSLQTFAHVPPLPPYALLRLVGRAAASEMSVEEREKRRPGCQNRLHFQKEINLFSFLMIDDCGAD